MNPLLYSCIEEESIAYYCLIVPTSYFTLRIVNVRSLVYKYYSYSEMPFSF
jgi:hypothetical protein